MPRSERLPEDVPLVSYLVFKWGLSAYVVKVRFADFTRLDLRVARIVSAEPIPGRSRILRGVIDLGMEQRTVVIGGGQHYTPDDLIGRIVIVVANLEPRTVAGVESNAMLLAADVDDRPYWLTVDSSVPPGSPIK